MEARWITRERDVEDRLPSPDGVEALPHPTIAARLKEETKPLHDAVESAVGLFDRPLTSTRYQSILERFYGFYSPLEERLRHVSGFDGVGFDFEGRKKTPLIQQDLVALGASAESVRSLPECTTVPQVSHLGEALGCLYVLEGAALGGRIIARQVHGLLGLTPEQGCAFFAGYGDETGARWREFGRSLEAYAAGGDEEAVHRSAQETFTAFGRWLVDGETGQMRGGG